MIYVVERKIRLHTIFQKDYILCSSRIHEGQRIFHNENEASRRQQSYHKVKLSYIINIKILNFWFATTQNLSLG